MAPIRWAKVNGIGWLEYKSVIEKKQYTNPG
jgi:hypothetical protein